MQPSELKEIFAKEGTDKGLISKIYKQLVMLSIKKTALIKWGENLNSQFSKEDLQMANKHMKKMLTLLTISKIHVKTTMRYQSHHTGQDSHHQNKTKLQTINAGEDVEKRERFGTLGGNVNWYTTMKNSLKTPQVSEWVSTQSCSTLCDPTDCSLSDFSVHGIFQAGIWSGLPFPPSGDLPNPGIEPPSPALQADSYCWATN